MKNISFLMILSFLSLNVIANDPMFNEQWGLSNNGQSIFRSEDDIRREEVKGIPGADIDWPGMEALNKLPKNEVIVAVIDSGIDPAHPDLAGRLLPGRDLLDNASISDDTGHGTHVAGIIAANLDGVGVQGVTPSQVKILPLKVLSKNTTGFVYKGKIFTDIVANAIMLAIDSNASVINMSLGWPQIINTPRIVKALDLAAEKGIVMIAASGNNNKDVPTWPCAHPAVVCVGAIDNRGNLTEFSNHGGKVDLVAPGEWIVSTIPRSLESRTLRKQGFEAKNGSSQAAPFVSAAAALLKVSNPDLTLDQVKARLYSSAKRLKANDQNKFVRFGALSIRGALASKTNEMASVLVKSLTSINVDSDGAYNFVLPLEILGESKSDILVEIQGLDASIEREEDSIRIKGIISDLKIDSEIPVEFSTSFAGTKTKTKMTLSFARKLIQADFLNVKISGIPVSSLIATQGALKAPLLSQVSVEDSPTFDFHGYVQGKLGDKIRVITFQANADDSEVKKGSIILDNHHQLLSVIEKDVNFDGKNDLIFYGMNSKRDGLILTFTDLNGEALLGLHSRWELPISTFEGLPLKDGDKANFSWLKHKTFLGDILVPYYQKTWMMPELDNSRNILEFEPAAPDLRLYYWEPYLAQDKVLIRPRVIDSVSFKKKLKSELVQSPFETLKIESILPQSTFEKNMGSARHLVSTGQGMNRTFFILNLKDSKNYEVSLHSDQDGFQSGNNVFMTRELDTFETSSDSFLLALLDRSSTRVKPLSHGQIFAPWKLTTGTWSDPFFEVVGTFKSEARRVLFFESRYHVYVYDQEGSGSPTSKKLPINRDSSFPGVNFSETIQTVTVKNNGKNEPAVAVNSTLIFGDRLYSMVSTSESFNRPIALSVNIPSSCVPLKPQRLIKENISAYAMLCVDGESVNLSFYPLSM